MTVYDHGNGIDVAQWFKRCTVDHHSRIRDLEVLFLELSTVVESLGTYLAEFPIPYHIPEEKSSAVSSQLPGQVPLPFDE